MKLKLIFAGSGEFGAPTLRRLQEAGHDIAAVYTQPDRPAGRGRALTPTPIATLASSRNLNVIKTSNINTETLPPADLLIVIAFGQKIAEHVVNHARFGAVNLHASRLPKYRGAAPINWAIVNGETITGNSIIRLAQKMDAGAILAQSELKIGETETAGELHDRLAIDGVALMEKVLDDLAAHRAIETPQDDTQSSLAPKLTRDTAKIDWSRPASQIAVQIRGLSPWPGCRVRIDDAIVTLARARPTASADGAPGEISDNGAIACGEGSIEIIELQPQGKRPMPLAAYRNGHPSRAGTQVISVT